MTMTTTIPTSHPIQKSRNPIQRPRHPIHESRPSVRHTFIRLAADLSARFPARFAGHLSAARFRFPARPANRVTTRPCGRLRRAALVVALVAAVVGASARGAMAAPLTLSYPVDLFPQPVAKFNTALGTLLSIDITISTVLAAVNPFASQGPNSQPCSAAFTGASLTISAPGTPTLLALDGLANTSGPCDRFEFGVSKQGAATVDPSYFSAFTSVGVSPITLNVTSLVGTVTFTRGTETRSSDPYWHPGLTSGQLTYTYCPVGEQCLTTPPPPPPPSVPEPTTIVTLTLGLTRLFARRRSPR